MEIRPMRPSWDNASLSEDEMVIDLAAQECEEQLAATATVLAARCHVRLLGHARRSGIDAGVEGLRRHLHERSGTRTPGTRRRVERALEAARTGRTGSVRGLELAALVDDLRIMEAQLRSDASG